MKITFTIKGFHCDACIRLSTMKLKKIPGVKNISITGLDGRTEIESDRPVDIAAVQEVLKDTEYTIQSNA